MTDPLQRALIQQSVGRLANEVNGIRSIALGATRGVRGRITVIRDTDGNPVSVIDPDTGLPHPQPTALPDVYIPTQPDVAAGVELIAVTYDGTFVDGNWDKTILYVRVHVLDDPTDTADDSTVFAAFTHSDGGTVSIPVIAGVDKYVKLQAVNIAGTIGTLSEVSDVVVALESADAALLTELDTVIIPGLAADLLVAQGQLNTLNTVTIPGINTTLATATADIATAQGNINTLNTVTLPGLNTTIAANSAAITTLNGKFPVATPDIATNAVTTAKIATDAVTASQIAASAVGSSELAAGAVIAGKITAGTIVAADIATGTITALQIAALTITASQIAANTITASQIAAGTITTNEMTANTINGDRILANTLNAAKIVSGSITSTQITANTINGDRIQTNTLNASRIQSTSITAAKIAAATITSNEIAANTIAAGNILAGTITTALMTANTINGDRITANTLDAAKIVANSITASQIAAGTITATQIAANTITAAKIAANTITTTELAATAINGMTVTGAVVQTASSGERMVLRNDGSGGIIESYSGVASETPGFWDPAAIGALPSVTMASGTTPTVTHQPSITLQSSATRSAVTIVGGNTFVQTETANRYLQVTDIGSGSATLLAPAITLGGTGNTSINVGAVGTTPAISVNGNVTLTGSRAGSGFAQVGYRGPASAQSVANAAFATMDLSGTSNHDIGSGFTKTTNIVTITNAGTYNIQASFNFQPATTTARGILYLETWTGTDPGVGLGTIFAFAEGLVWAGGNCALHAGDQLSVVAGQNIRAIVFQNSGAAVNGGGGSGLLNRLSLARTS